VENKNICVFGASAEGLEQNLVDAVTSLGQSLGDAGFSLVFGGFARGLMAATAKGFEKSQAEIIGVIAQSLADRLVYPGCTSVIETKDLDQRKQKMTELAAAFLTVPGAIGTLDELFGVMAQKLIDETAKPLIIYNYNGFYDPLIKWLDQLQAMGYIHKNLEDMIFISDNPQEILEYLNNYL